MSSKLETDDRPPCMCPWSNFSSRVLSQDHHSSLPSPVLMSAFQPHNGYSILGCFGKSGLQRKKSKLPYKYTTYEVSFLCFHEKTKCFFKDYCTNCTFCTKMLHSIKVICFKNGKVFYFELKLAKYLSWNKSVIHNGLESLISEEYSYLSWQ